MIGFKPFALSNGAVGVRAETETSSPWCVFELNKPQPGRHVFYASEAEAISKAVWQGYPYVAEVKATGSVAAAGPGNTLVALTALTRVGRLELVPLKQIENPEEMLFAVLRRDDLVTAQRLAGMMPRTLVAQAFLEFCPLFYLPSNPDETANQRQQRLVQHIERVCSALNIELPPIAGTLLRYVCLENRAELVDWICRKALPPPQIFKSIVFQTRAVNAARAARALQRVSS